MHSRLRARHAAAFPIKPPLKPCQTRKEKLGILSTMVSFVDREEVGEKCSQICEGITVYVCGAR